MMSAPISQSRTFPFLFACALAITLTACSRSPEQPAAASLRIVVSIPPLAGLVRELAPEGADVTTIVPPGASEHGYEPPPSAIAAIGRADLVVLVGMGLEPRIDRALHDHPRPDRVELRFADALGLNTDHDHDHDHEHGPDCDHGDDVASDPHLWLDPILVAEFVPALRDAIIEALERRAPLTDAERTRLDEAATRLVSHVHEIHRMYTMALAPYAGAPIVTHHDAFGRLAARYGLEVAAFIRLGEGSEPTPGAVANVARLVRERNVGAIFVEPQYSSGVARRIAETTGVRTLTLDPLGDGDWSAMMRANLTALFDGLAAPEAPSSPAPDAPAPR